MKIIFEFVGGPMDGKNVVGHAGDQAPNDPLAWASAYYSLTNSGQIGKRFKTISEYGIGVLQQSSERIVGGVQGHVYEVKDRLEGDNEVLVRCEHVKEGQAPPS